MRRTVALTAAAAFTALAVLVPTGWRPGWVPPPGYHTLGTKWTSAPAVLR